MTNRSLSSCELTLLAICIISNVLLLLLVPSCDGVQGQNFERDLLKKLFADYDTAIRPTISRNASEHLNVTFGLALTQLIDIDERNQILTTNCWLNQGWVDSSLRWNPADYGGIKVIRIPADKVWRPDIILYNNADSQYNLAILSTNVIITSEGNITWLSTAIFKSSCLINVEFFPFDEQNCTMKFASWTYDGYQVNLLIQTEEGDLSNYVQNGEWQLLHFRAVRNVVFYSCCPDEPYPDVTYTIVLHRRPLFYVFNLILPCVLITGLALMSFYMPSDSGEKVTLGITTLLSMTVFLMVIGESMPPTSEKLPLIGLYYGVTISLVSFATGLSVVTLNIHHRGMRGRKLPSYLRFLLFNILAKVLFLRLDFPKRDPKKKSCCACISCLNSSSKRNLDGNPGRHSPTASTNYQENSEFEDQICYKHLGNLHQDAQNLRRLAKGDTWRIVYPDMPSTPPPQTAPISTSSNSQNRHQHQSNNPSQSSRRKKSRYPQQSDHYSTTTTICDGKMYTVASTQTGEKYPTKPIMRVCAMTRNSSNDRFVYDFEHQLEGQRSRSEDQRKSHGFGFLNPEDLEGTPEPAFPGSLARISNWERHVYQLLAKVHDAIDRNEERVEEHDRKETIKIEWQQAALIIDRLLLWIFVVGTIFATFSILYMSPHTKLFTN